ncbi:RNA polymerase sigma factor [Flavisphingomonas formosensis]|uniref:RNA polymerase sigma factor n=1 Tax=Flavisphingomonas formosensis TaxID=861534 RepID=UPI0012F83320|nr:RNA polymerase sigma factor [Sphingomonas formosensis]
MAEAGLAQLLVTMRQALMRFLAARGASGDEAEDILQDLYLKAAALGSGPIAEPRAYLYRMADNLLLDRRRAAMRRVRREQSWVDEQTAEGGEADPQPSAERGLIARQQVEQVKRILDALPERTGEALRRFRMEGQSQKEIAAAFGISLSAVEKHLQRAYRAIVECRESFDADFAGSRRLEGGNGKKAIDDG